MGFRQGISWYYNLCGARGVCAAASYRLFGAPGKLKIIPRGTEHPVYLRLNTSDFCSYKDVLIAQEKQYVPGALGFVPRIIVDAGAHIGMVSILFALKYPLAKIFAIEPEPANFAALCRNVSPYQNVVPFQAALWREDGEVSLCKSDAHPKGSFHVAESGDVRVRSITMDALMKELGIGCIDLLKVDIEGAEKEVFEAHAWISQVRAIAIELHDRIKPGCRQVVEAATRDFHSSEFGDVTFFLR